MRDILIASEITVILVFILLPISGSLWTLNFLTSPIKPIGAGRFFFYALYPAKAEADCAMCSIIPGSVSTLPSQNILS